MRKIVQLTENDIKRLVLESINELKQDTIHNAWQTSERLPGGVHPGKLNNDDTDFDARSLGTTFNVGDLIVDIESTLEEYGRYCNPNNRRYQNAVQGIKAVREFFFNKVKQSKNFEDTFFERQSDDE